MTTGDRGIDIDDDRLSRPERPTLLAACLVVALSLLLPAAGPAWAGFDDGIAAAKRGRLPGCVRNLASVGGTRRYAGPGVAAKGAVIPIPTILNFDPFHGSKSARPGPEAYTGPEA